MSNLLLSIRDPAVAVHHLTVMEAFPVMMSGSESAQSVGSLDLQIIEVQALGCSIVSVYCQPLVKRHAGPACKGIKRMQ